MPATEQQMATTFYDLVARHGYRRTSVEDVARALGISKKTIYQSFSSKEELHRYAMDLWAHRQRDRVESLLSARSALGRIPQAISIAVDDARTGFAATPLGDASDPLEVVTDVNSRVFGPLVRDLIAAANAAGEIDVPDPDLTAGFCVAIGVEAIRRLRENPALDIEAAMVSAVRRLLGADAPTKGQRR